MAASRLLAQMTVADLASAISWYSTLFDREPDARPMDGLVEWHLAPTFGVQIWTDAEPGGKSAMVIDESDLDGLATRLAQQGIEHSGVEDVTASRILRLADPEGNRILFTGPFRSEDS